MKEALVLMAKAPIEGQVKTRLIGALTAAEAKQLYIVLAISRLVNRVKPLSTYITRSRH